MSFEIALGRWLAWVVHPESAWRQLHGRGRAVIVASYAGVGYLATLLVLIAAG